MLHRFVLWLIVFLRFCNNFLSKAESSSLLFYCVLILAEATYENTISKYVWQVKQLLRVGKPRNLYREEPASTVFLGGSFLVMLPIPLNI